MKIYTKTGDKGMTGLVGGARVSKDDPRVNAYGSVDELISVLALLRAELPEGQHSSDIRRIQSALMLGAAHIAADDFGSGRLNSFNPGETEFLEQQIDEMTAILPEQTAFILPGGPKSAALCHMARSVCRRAERASIFLISEPRIEVVIRYLNRLSDYLFVYARYLAFSEGVADDFWHQ